MYFVRVKKKMALIEAHQLPDKNNQSTEDAICSHSAVIQARSPSM